MTKRRERNSPQRGQTMLELAFLLPMLLLMVFGVIEMGRYAFLSIIVGNAAHAGAAYGAQSAVLSIDTPGILAAADNDFQNNGQNVNTLTVVSSVACGCDNAGTITSAPACSTSAFASAGTCATGHWVITVSVTASGTFNSIFRYPGIPPSISISRTAKLRVAG